MLRNVTAVCFSRGFPQNTYTYLFVPLAVTLTVLKGMPHLHFSANGRYLSISYRKPFRNHVWSFSAKILFTKKKGLTTHAVLFLVNWSCSYLRLQMYNSFAIITLVFEEFSGIKCAEFCLLFFPAVSRFLSIM